MQTVWEILYARKMSLHYAAPPICEVIFSGSSSPIIVLSEPAISQVTGLVLGGVGNFDLSWNAFPGALCYNVYFIGNDNVAVPLAQCIQDPFFRLPEDLDPGIIVVTQITLEGEGPPSDPVPYPGGPGSVVTVEALCPQVSVSNFPTSFFISRESGDTAGNLTVNYSLGGTAFNGTDYVEIPFSATIPNGSESVSVFIVPIEGFSPSKNVVMTLAPGGYTIGVSNSASILMRPAFFKITNYGGSEPLFTPPGTATAAAHCEWDGSVNTFFGGGPPDSWIFSDENGTTVLPNASIQGRQVYQASVSGPGPVPNTWFLNIDCLNGAGFPVNIAAWRGAKIGGLTAAGVYTRTSGSDLRPNVTLQAVP